MVIWFGTLLSGYLVRYFLEYSAVFDDGRKPMPATLKKPTLDELYRRLRDLEHSQVDQRMAVMLNTILQLDSEGEGNGSGADGGLHVGWNIKPRANQVAVMEHRQRLEIV